MDHDKKLEIPFIREMFEKIAPTYDLLNRVLSLKQDVLWRKIMVKSTPVPKKGRVLDVACGTGDVAIEMAHQKGGLVVVDGIDFSVNMLFIARKKTEKALMPNIRFTAADAFNPPFNESAFDAVTIAFGIRNIADKTRVLGVFNRMLKPGGALSVLELSTPQNRFFKTLYLLYFTKLLPMIGSFFSKDNHAYSYLPDSVMHFPPPAQFRNLMENAGFSDVHSRPLTFGIAVLYTGKKPAHD